MLFKKKENDNPISSDIDEALESTIKPKIWKLFNWLIFCSFILVLSSYLNAKIFLFSFFFVISIVLVIKLYLLNKLPPMDFRIYIFIFFIIFILCEYNHFEIIYFGSFKISNIDYFNLITDPGIFIGALCNIIFTTKIHVASNLFFSENFIQWLTTYLDVNESEALLKIDSIFFGIFGYIIPVIINFLYAMLIGVLIVRVKQLFIK